MAADVRSKMAIDTREYATAGHRARRGGYARGALALGCGLMMLSPFAHADTLIFANGDRLTGTVAQVDEREIHFVAELLGPIVVSTDRASVVSDSPQTTSPNGGLSGAGLNQSDPANNDLSATTRPPSGSAVGARWRREVEFGVTDQSGRSDRRDVSARLTLVRRTEADEIRLQGRYLYGQNEAERAVDKLGGALRFRRGLTPLFFAQTETRYERDSISEIEHDAEQSIGLGTGLIKRDGLALSVGGGAAARFRSTALLQDGWSYLVDAFQEFKCQLTRDVSLSQDLSVVMSPFQEEVFSVKLSAALSSALTETINLVMRYEFEYDRSLAESARENQRLVTSFGYLF